MITYAAKSTLASSNGAAFNLAYVGGISAGDLLIINAISVQEGGSIGDIDTPAGWNFLAGGTGFRNSTPINVGTYKCFYKIATGLEAGVVAMSRTGHSGGGAPPTPFGAQMYRYTGTRIVLNTASANILGDGNGTITWPSVGGPNDMTKIALVGQRSGDPGNPTGFTARAADDNGSIYLEVADLGPTSGASGATGTGGQADGWATAMASFFEAKGRNQIFN